MRQRRVKGIDEKLAGYADLILQPDAAVAPDSAEGYAKADGLSVESVELLQAGGFSVGAAVESARKGPQIPEGRAVRWYQRPSPGYAVPDGFGRAYAEFGCGRGGFINAVAEADPDGLYIGIEGCKTIVISALAKTRAAGFQNIRYIDAFVNDASSAFGDEALDGIFLNFSDPWPKDRHADRRLTSLPKASAYFSILKPGGFIKFKTDKEAFFEYSLRSLTQAGFRIVRETRDLPEGETTPSEYEQKFRALGLPIYYIEAVK